MPFRIKKGKKNIAVTFKVAEVSIVNTENLSKEEIESVIEICKKSITNRVKKELKASKDIINVLETLLGYLEEEKDLEVFKELLIKYIEAYASID